VPPPCPLPPPPALDEESGGSRLADRYDVAPVPTSRIPPSPRVWARGIGRDSVERVGPDDEEWEEDKREVVPLGSQRDGDADGDGGMSSLGRHCRGH
jgi:hypothetical protein